MKQLKEIGNCPNCDCSLIIYRSSNYKRFVQCWFCGLCYPLPKKGKIYNSSILCPRSGFPILIIENPKKKAYFWTDQPCFQCIKFHKCLEIQSLIEEFKDLEVYGYYKDK